MNTLKSIFFSSFFLLVSINVADGKICNELPKLDLQECGRYEFIAYGRVDWELNCEEGKVLFTPVSVFKGESDESLFVFTDCSDEGIPMSKGEYWLLFGKKNNAQEIKLNICEHSRVQLPKEEIDYLLESRGSSFQDDLSFLKDNFTKKEIGKKELLPKRYERISPLKTIVLLGVGLVFMLVGFFVIKRMK